MSGCKGLGNNREKPDTVLYDVIVSTQDCGSRDLTSTLRGIFD